MPLKVVRRQDTGGTLWITGTIRPAGSKESWRIRQRAGSNDEALAREEAASVEREFIRNYHLGHRPVEHSFSEAATSYIQAEPRSRATVQFVVRLVRHFRDTPLRQINQEAIDRARPVVLRAGVGPGTVRRNLIVPMRAIMIHANRRGWCDVPKFDLPKEPRGRTAFLLPEQVEAILAAASERHRPLFRFLICTGCRMGETLALTWDQVDLSAGLARLWADQTKARQERVVTLPPAAVVALAGLAHRSGHVFRSRYRDEAGEFLPYQQSGYGGGGQVAKGWAAACHAAGIVGVTPHVLRHSWASWHYALNRDLLGLKQAGGWSSVELVERYAHLLPRGHEDGIRRVWGVGELVVVEKRA